MSKYFGHVARIAFIASVIGGCVDSNELSGLATESSGITSRWTGRFNQENVASSQAGATAYSSGDYYSQPVSAINDSERSTTHTTTILGRYPYWQSSTSAPSNNCNYGNWWVSSRFNGVHSISEVDVYALQDNYVDGYEPTYATTTSSWGIVDFHLSYCPEGVKCTSTAGWVDVPGGYVTGNHSAVVTRSFASVRATGMRVSIDCAQSPQAHIAEIEAWETTTSFVCNTIPPSIPGHTPVITGTATTQIQNDSDVFWGSGQGFSNWNQVQEKASIHQAFHDANGTGAGIPINLIGRQALAAAQMYDRLAPIDPCRAAHYLEYLRVQAEELLLWRDDNQGYPADANRQRNMAAWGFVAADRDNRWTDDVSTAGFFTFPMAAFAKRVAANPSAFSIGYQKDAVRFTTAVMQTYSSFRPELYYSTSQAWAYHVAPAGYASLACSDSNFLTACKGYRLDANHPEEWNENLDFIRTLAEVAPAADSSLYRNSTEPQRDTTITYLTLEGPDVVSKYVQFFNDYLNVSDHLKYWSGDNAAYYIWNKGYAGNGSAQTENTPHAQVTVSSLALILENKSALDLILSRSGSADRINLSAASMERFAVTFLRLIWNTSNYVGELVDGSSPGTAAKNYNGEVAGFITISPYDPWVWQRAHDALFAVPSSFREDNYAALIRYE